MREQHNQMLRVERLKCLAAKVNHQTQHYLEGIISIFV